ncbi:acid protease [Mycena sp. CBHHK59/15]|nr:acid protease [Mycena sp. CBHHK59/15]
MWGYKVLGLPHSLSFLNHLPPSLSLPSPNHPLSSLMAEHNSSHNVSFKANINVVNVKEILARDRARAKHLLAGRQPHGPVAFHRAKKSSHCHKGAGGSSEGGSSVGQTIAVTDAAVTYTACVGVGQPATNYNLLIDTGSSNTWILGTSSKPYKPTSTSKDTRNKFEITYGLGSCSGTEYTDEVTLSPKLVIKDQPIGVADQANQMDGLDGILGIGPVDLTLNTMTPDSSNKDGILTVTDNLLKQKLISSECIGVSYVPTTSADAANGSLSFGGPDSSKYTGKLNYVPITKQAPASNYWGIEQSVSYGSDMIMNECAGIMDTGTTLVMIASDAFEEYRKQTGATMDQSLGLLTVTEEQYNNMQSMYFDIGGVKYEFTKNAQIFPRSMNASLGSPEDKICLIIADMGTLSGQGLDFINGFAFLQRFYSVYDVSNSQVGIATTEYTMATSN